MTNIANFLRIILPILPIFDFFHSISARFMPYPSPKTSDCAFADKASGCVFADKADRVSGRWNLGHCKGSVGVRCCG